jgi:hypothetical protein
MENVKKELKGLIWTLAGTGLVLITLSGSTRTTGIWISVAAIVLSLGSAYLSKDE